MAIATIPMITTGAGLFFFEDAILYSFNVESPNTIFKPSS